MIVILKIYVINLFCGMEVKNSPFGKNLEENPEAVSRNQLNVSKAKMQYSFQQSDRFNPNAIM